MKLKPLKFAAAALLAASLTNSLAQPSAVVAPATQNALQPAVAAAPQRDTAIAQAQVTVAAAAVRGVEVPGAVRMTHAAGSVIILAEGIVANARTAQILPPAPGFVYER